MYDGWNAVQELSGTTVTANRITGSVDEFFSRSDSSGTYPLSDALGSTVALANSSGVLTTQYAYEPFGATVSGASSSNPFQYTGRENEGNGLYYYRARYYSPSFARFISEDPIGFWGGINEYAYALNSPLNFNDPSGLYSGWDFLYDFGGFSEGFADTLTLGSASTLNNAFGAGSAVNRCGWSHKAGTVAGIAFSTVVGGSLGAEAAEAHAGEEGFEFSHWIPERMGGPRSVFNGNFVSRKFAYLTDFYRYPPPAGAALRWGPKLSPMLQQFLRIPWVYVGAAGGSAYGVAGALAGRSCGC